MNIAAAADQARMAVLLTVTAVPAGAATVTVSRTAPSGNSAVVRGASDATVTGTTFIARDWEAPFNLELAYTAEAFDTAGGPLGTAQVSFTLVWAGCDAWFVDLAVPLNSNPETIVSMTELDYDAAAAVHRVLNRRAPVMTSLPAWTPTTELIVLTETLTRRDQMRALLGSGYPFLLRTDPAQGVGNMYLGVAGFVEERFLTPGDAAERQFRIDAVQVERPDPALFSPAPPMTYQDVFEAWATYADMKAAVGTYDRLAWTFPDGSDFGPVIPWLPDDI